MIVLEELSACPVCHTRQAWTPVVEAEDFETHTGTYTVVACTACGLQFTNPRPNEASIPELYGARTTSDFAPQAGASLTQRLRNLVIDRYLDDALAEFRGQQDVSVLDFGCGDGALSLGIARWGARTGSQVRITAIDFHGEAPPALRDAAGNIGYLDFWTWRERSERYDTVFLRHVLEHHSDPVGLVRQLQASLSPRGVLHIEVPNRDSVWARVFGRNFFSYYLPRHLMHFDPASLRRVVGDGGLKVEQLRRAHTPVIGRSLGHWLGREIDNLGLLGLASYPLQVVLDVVTGRSTTLRVKARP